MSGERGFTFEPVNTSGFGDNLGGGQSSRAGQQGGRHGADPGVDALAQRMDGFGEPVDVGQLGAGEFGDQPRWAASNAPSAAR